MTQSSDPRPSGPRLLLLTGGALGLAGLILAVAVLPAEFGRDPTGLGRITGLDRLWGPPQIEADATAASRAPTFAGAPRSDVIEVPLGPATGPRNLYQLEYKVRMKAGAVLVYAWEVEGARNASDVYFDFHGHTVSDDPRAAMTVATYRQATGGAQAGALTAPFDGIHGWFFQNSGVAPVKVRLRLSGFYELVPPGAPGNEARILPVPEAAPGA